MPRNDNKSNGNGNGATVCAATDTTLEQQSSNAGFQLNADATIGSLLNASDQDYAAFVAQLRKGRQLKIKQRAREVANLLNPHLQMEEIMCEAQQIVDVETAGVSPTGHTLPNFRNFQLQGFQ